MELNRNGVGSDNTDNSDCESNTSSDDCYDNDASDEEIDELELQQLKKKIICHKCGRFFSSECHLKCHQGYNYCK